MLARTIRHEELKGGYTMGKKTIIDACEIFGEFEIMAMYEDDEELESKTVSTEIEAIKVFDDLFMKYAEPLQKALYNKLQEGKRYTLVYLDELKRLEHHIEELLDLDNWAEIKSVYGVKVKEIDEVQ